MIGLLQRVKWAWVEIDGRRIAEIKTGMMVLVGVERTDTVLQAQKLAERLLAYRCFADLNDKMNLNVQNVQGEILLVPQFTLPADTSSGLRPSFTPAAPPDLARELFGILADQVKILYRQPQIGEFGANMQVGLLNDGPVTFWLQVK